MTDAGVTAALQAALAIETALRHAMETAGEDLAERDSAVVAARHARALRMSIESWIGRRALRAQFAQRSA